MTFKIGDRVLVLKTQENFAYPLDVNQQAIPDNSLGTVVLDASTDPSRLGRPGVRFDNSNKQTGFAWYYPESNLVALKPPKPTKLRKGNLVVYFPPPLAPPRACQVMSVRGKYCTLRCLLYPGMVFNTVEQSRVVRVRRPEIKKEVIPR